MYYAHTHAYIHTNTRILTCVYMYLSISWNSLKIPGYMKNGLHRTQRTHYGARAPDIFTRTFSWSSPLVGLYLCSSIPMPASLCLLASFNATRELEFLPFRQMQAKSIFRSPVAIATRVSLFSYITTNYIHHVLFVYTWCIAVFNSVICKRTLTGRLSN